MASEIRGSFAAGRVSLGHVSSDCNLTVDGNGRRAGAHTGTSLIEPGCGDQAAQLRCGVCGWVLWHAWHVVLLYDRMQGCVSLV